MCGVGAFCYFSSGLLLDFDNVIDVRSGGTTDIDRTICEMRMYQGEVLSCE
jgi:hypothetical protein